MPSTAIIMLKLPILAALASLAIRGAAAEAVEVPAVPAYKDFGDVQVGKLLSEETLTVKYTGQTWTSGQTWGASQTTYRTEWQSDVGLATQMIIVDAKRIAVDFRTPGAIAAGTNTEAATGAAKISCTYSDGEAKSKASCVLEIADNLKDYEDRAGTFKSYTIAEATIGRNTLEVAAAARREKRF